jgi:autotransporter-associated beta strand protein
MLASLRRSSIAFLLACLAWTGSVQAAGIIRITEAMSSSGTGGTPDWFEITNYGTTAVDLSGWTMDDNGFIFAASVPLTPYTTGTEAAWTSIAPGRSIVFLETDTPATAVPNFRTFWGGLSDVLIGTYPSSGRAVGFSSGGDGAIVFNNAGAEVHRVSFGAAIGGSSFYWNYDASGALASAGLGSISTAGFANAFTTTGAVANTGSPGLSVTAGPVVNLYWTVNGIALGGNGSWDVVSNRWSATASPVNGGPWADERTAVFSGTGGTVTVNAAVAPVGLDFQTTGYTLASGSGSIATTTANVVAGGTATIAARLTGPGGLGISGGGSLILSGTASDYLGLTSVAEGTLRTGASEVIPNGSRLAVSRFMTADLSGHRETVNGIAGLGTIITGSSLTVSITGSNDIVFDGFLRGSGDFIVDSPGTGAQRLDTSATTLNDGAVKDYAGRTIVQRGALAVHFNGTPDKTTAVDIEAAGTLRLASNGRTYSFGLNSATATRVNLNGGTVTQGQGDDVELTNPVAVSGTTGRIVVVNDTTPDPLNPSTEEITLSGVLSGTAGTVLTLMASNTTPGADKSRVEFVQAAGNTFAGTIKPQVNMTARVDGDYGQMSVALAGGEIDGYGVVNAISGVGTVAPRGTLASGILTASSAAPQAGMNFEFDFATADSDPVWFSPSSSENDVLRLTGATPIASALTSANTVRLYFGTTSLDPTTTFKGGFFTTADSTALITNATLEAYVLGDGLGTDIVHADLGYYSLASYATATSQTLTPSWSMVAVEALFDGVTTTNGFVTKVAFNEPLGPPPGSIVINVPSGSQTQGQAGHPLLSGTTPVEKIGAGTAVLDQSNPLTGPTTVAQGTLQLATADALSSSAVTVAAGATLSVGPQVAALVPALVNNGLVDVGLGGLTVASGQTGEGIMAAIIAGRADGSWSGTSGITSSAAATQSERAVGWLNNGDGSFTVSFAAAGDWNVNGVVDFDDVVQFVSANLYDTGLPATWADGDYDYNGVVDFDDVVASVSANLFDAGPYNAGTPLGGLALPAGGGLSEPNVLAGGIVAVPEPAGIILAMTAAASLVALWQRRKPALWRDSGTARSPSSA